VAFFMFLCFFFFVFVFFFFFFFIFGRISSVPSQELKRVTRRERSRRAPEGEVRHGRHDISPVSTPSGVPAGVSYRKPSAPRGDRPHFARRLAGAAHEHMEVSA